MATPRKKRKAAGEDELIGAPRAIVPLCVRDYDAADMLGVTKDTLRRWRLEGRGPRYAVIGRRTIVYPLDELREYLIATLVKENDQKKKKKGNTNV